MNNLDAKLEKAIEVCVQKYFKFHKTKNILKNNILNLINEHVEDYAAYDHYYPYAVHWVLGSECNLRCKHCLYLESPQKYKPENDLSTEQALNLIDEFIEMDILSITLTGGEIFLRKDIFEILTKLKSKNISLTLLTNATLITPEIVEKLKLILNVHTDRIQVSLDGATKQTHEKTRGQGSFDKTINGIALLVDAGFTTSLMCIPTSINVHELLDVYNLAQRIGAKYLTFGKFLSFSHNQKYLIPDTSVLFEAIAKAIVADNQKDKSMLNMTTFSFYDLIRNNIALKFIEKYNTQDKSIKLSSPRYTCHHNEKISIDKNGNVYFCTYAKDFEFDCLGCVKEKTLKEIWASRTNCILFQKRDTNKITCKDCGFFQNGCFGGCPVDAHLKYGTINAPDKNCHIGERLMCK